MEGYGYRWYRVGGLDYVLKRSVTDLQRGKSKSPS
jgi:maltose alpha-D-glucosyltransferase/alpha-amylase